MDSADSDSSCSGNRILPVTPKNVISLPASITKHHKSRKKTNISNLDLSVDYDQDCLPNRKSFIDKIFKDYDDVHVPFVKSDKKSCDGITSQNTYSAIDDTPSTPISSEQYITEEVKNKRILATIEGRKDFCEILEHVGINSNTYLAGVFSSKKKTKCGFESSTPVLSKNFEGKINGEETPSLSGIISLSSPLNFANNSNFFSTPVSKNSSTPHLIIKGENLEKILLGITCYVDVKTGKENCSESCQRELLLIGAKVEKNFTKKVTHVVFKEGKMSTYVRAKKNNIPIVSVTWIEACKVARGPVDPNLYPPVKLEKYECDSPFTFMMRRKLSRLRRKGGLLDVTRSLKFCSSEVKNKRRQAATELKENKAPKKILNKEKRCTKKLNFNNSDKPEVSSELSNDNLLECTKNSFDQLSDSSIFAEFKIENLQNKKNIFLNKKKNGYKKIDDYFVAEDSCEQIEGEFVKNKCLKQLFNESKYRKPIDNEGRTVTDHHLDNLSENKKRKLYDPSAHVLDGCNIAAAGSEVSYPYEDTPKPISKKRKLSDGDNNKSNFTKRIDLSTDQYQEEDSKKETINSSKSRNSSIFIKNDVKFVDTKPKYLPTIVFTSIHRSECDKLTKIVKKLGDFDIEEQVSERTTHVVTSSLRRTLNLLRGLARGCWIIGIDWILKSESTSKWLSEEYFELKTFSPAVTECRLQKRAFKNSFKMDLFSSCGSIFVAPNTLPPSNDLIHLIKLCCGKVVTCARGAKIIVGREKSRNNRTVTRVREKWVLDSISNNVLQDVSNYIISVNEKK